MYETLPQGPDTRCIQRTGNGEVRIVAHGVPTALARRICATLNRIDLAGAPEADGNDDDIQEAAGDAVSDGEGRIGARSLRYHLAKRGLAVVPVR